MLLFCSLRMNNYVAMCRAWYLLSRKIIHLLKLEILENMQQFFVNVLLLSFEYCYTAFSLIKPGIFHSYHLDTCLV